MVIAVVQARMASSRLPGKVMMKVAGRPMIGHTLRRLAKCKNIDRVILATTGSPDNKLLRDYAKSQGVDAPLTTCHENDVLGRYLEVADRYNAETIVRITGDCPLIDPEITDQTIAALGTHEFSTNVLHRTFAKGLDTEVMTRECLHKIDRLCNDDRREHVTLYIYRNAHKFDIKEVTHPRNKSEIIVCVDYPEDLERVRQILTWNEDASYEEVLRYVEALHESEARGILTLSGSAAGGNPASCS